MRRHPAAASLDPFEAIARHSAGLADAAEGELMRTVPSCPNWTMGDLVEHVYHVHAFWGRIVADRLVDVDAAEEADRDVERPADLVSAFRRQAGEFVALLKQSEPATRIWTWAPQQDVAFVIRHQVQEAAVHRWDGANAIAAPFTIDVPSAVDSIEEFLTFSLRSRPENQPLGREVALVAADADAEWTLHEDDAGAIAWSRGADGAAVRVSGTASDLLLALYRRVPLSDMGVTGDPTVVERLLARTHTD